MCRMRKSQLSRYKQERLIEHFIAGSTAQTAGNLGGAGKPPVFGLLKRGGYTEIILDVTSTTLIPMIERKVMPDSIVYSDCWKGYHGFDVSDFHHFRINTFQAVCSSA